MTIYFIYFLIFLIFLFLLFLIFKAVNRGIEAKKFIKKNKVDIRNKDNDAVE
jgi:hypothetical protein